MRIMNEGAKQWLGRAIVAAVLLTVISVGVCVCIGISTSLHSEKALHAVNLVTEVVNRFVQQEKRWPSSWEDLRSVNDAKAAAMYSWPADFKTVQKFVAVKFDANLAAIASQTVEDFDSIEPIGSCYPYKHYDYVSSLIETAKAVNDRQH